MPSDDTLAATAIQQLCQEDLSLIQRIVERDRSALSELYDRYAGIIYSVAYHSLDSVVESEEIVMEVFTKIWQIADLYNADRTRVDTWIFTIVRTLILDLIRTKQPPDKSTIALARFSNGEATPTIAVFDLTTATVDVPADLGIAARRTQVLTTLTSLSTKQRQVLALAYFRGWSHREIAEQTGMALKTVKICIWLSLEKLRSLYPHNSPVN
jgi:RNA polymerase sigma-70 factor, ECF subfamily